jgi:hypothetical protein
MSKSKFIIIPTVPQKTIINSFDLSEAVTTLRRTEEYLSSLEIMLSLLAECNQARDSADLHNSASGLGLIVTAIQKTIENVGDKLKGMSDSLQVQEGGAE